MLSAVVLASAYALRLPAVAGVAAFDSLARVSAGVVGRATLAYGLGAVNVFNKEDLLTNRFSLQAWWGDGTERVAGFAEITPYLSATEQHTLTALQQRRAAHGRYCDEPFVRDYFAPLGWRHAEPILRDALDRPLYLHTVFTYVQWPTAADLAAFRYVPVEARPVCEVVVDAETAEPFLTVYSEYGTDLMNGGVELPFQARADVMPLLGRFPCSAEARRARHWLEQLEDGRPRDAALLATLDAAMDAPHTLSPAECFALVEAAGASRDLDWRASNLPPADQPCDADLGVANEIYSRVLTGPRRDAVLPYLNGAVVAHARGDYQSCLLAASEVRRTYRRDLGIAGLTTEAPPLLPGSDLPFRVRPEAMPLLERFPCEAEARRVAWWVADPGVEASGRTSSELLASLGRAGATDPLECLDRVESAVTVYGLDWLRADSPPPTASCDADLALATFYVDTVLDDRQREVARAALTNAVAAHERGSGTECMLAAASVRQEFLVDVGARAPSRASSESMVRVANVPFPVRRDAAPLLARFPCMAEAQRIAWWADRPDRPERASVMQAVDPILRGADGVDASACLGTIRSVLESLDLDWRVDHAPPAWAPCDADIALAAAYVDTAFDRTLGTTAKRHFSVALTAMQQGDNALCLRATAAVRRLYWQRIGAPIVRAGATARRP